MTLRWHCLCGKEGTVYCGDEDRPLNLTDIYQSICDLHVGERFPNALSVSFTPTFPAILRRENGKLILESQQAPPEWPYFDFQVRHVQ